MAKKGYTPTAPYVDLKRVEGLLKQAQTVDELRKLVVREGPGIGYKAFCYLLGGQMTAEAMKPEEACLAAEMLEAQGHQAEAQEIYRRVAAAHPDHPLARQKSRQP